MRLGPFRGQGLKGLNVRRLYTPLAFAFYPPLILCNSIFRAQQASYALGVMLLNGPRGRIKVLLELHQGALFRL